MMTKQKILWLTIVCLTIISFLFSTGVFLPKTYCIDKVCIQRPQGFYLQFYSGTDGSESSYCRFTMNCRSHFSYSKGNIDSLVFSNMFNERVGLVVSSDLLNTRDQHSVTSYKNCDLIKIEPLDTLYVQGFINNSNMFFGLSSTDKTLTKVALEGICDHMTQDK